MRPEVQRIVNATCRIDTAKGTRASGFFITQDGYMVTCCHVVEGVPSLHVYWHGHPQPIELTNPIVLAQDFSRDLAILNVEYTVPYLEVSDRRPEMGDRFIMCGYPLWAGVPRITEGVVSSPPEEIENDHGMRILAQALNANVNHGNSGGPVCTPEGVVIGVAVAKVAADAVRTAEALLRALGLALSDHRRRQTAEAFALFAERVDAGIGFSVPSNVIPGLLTNARNLARGGLPQRRSLPTISVSRAALTEFQRKCNQLDVSPVGPFSCNESFEIWPVKPRAGKTSRRDRTLIPHSLHDLLKGFFEARPIGGRFYLLGEAICTPTNVSYEPIARIRLTSDATLTGASDVKHRSEFLPSGLTRIGTGLADIKAGRVKLTHPAVALDALKELWSGPVERMELSHDDSLGQPSPRFLAFAELSAPDWLLGMTDEFRKGISAVDRKLQGRILEAISYITKTPVSPKGDTVRPLSGELKELWRYRIGKHRLVYRPDEATRKVTLVAFTGREDAY